MCGTLVLNHTIKLALASWWILNQNWMYVTLNAIQKAVMGEL